MKALNLVNQKFGRLLVIKKSHRKNKKVMWECLCDCGNTTYVQTYYLTSGKIRSCGCLHKDQLLERNITHNKTHTKLYRVWCAMKKRCNNPNDCAYHNYGGRGITVCVEWENCFDNFYNWSMANGYSDNLTIDRINVNGNYCPDNCRWADRITQANNTRANHLLTFNGKTDTLANWARGIGIKEHTLSNRIHNCKWSVEKALTTPVNNTQNTRKSTDV